MAKVIMDRINGRFATSQWSSKKRVHTGLKKRQANPQIIDSLKARIKNSISKAMSASIKIKQIMVTMIDISSLLFELSVVVSKK